jgi:hypothetical protein
MRPLLCSTTNTLAPYSTPPHPLVDPVAHCVVRTPCPSRISLLSPVAECEDEELSTALGYVAHLVFMVSKYLRVPLRYAIFHNASRSCLHDNGSGPNGSAVEYPLYKRGVERERFERAVHLLKKDIEQLMHARGKSPAKGSHMLANLKALLNHETSSVL